jgi:putative transposase
VRNSSLLRNSFKYTSKRDWPELACYLKPIYTAPSADAALGRFAGFSERWERRCPAVIRLWTDARAEFVPFLEFDIEIRKIICMTDAIESVNARLRGAVRDRGHFPTEQVICDEVPLHSTHGTRPHGPRARPVCHAMEAALNAFDIDFEGRLTAAQN